MRLNAGLRTVSRRRRKIFLPYGALVFLLVLNGLDGLDIHKPLILPEIIGKFLNHLRPFSGVRSGLETRKPLISPTFRQIHHCVIT